MDVFMIMPLALNRLMTGYFLASANQQLVWVRLIFTLFVTFFVYSIYPIIKRIKNGKPFDKKEAFWIAFWNSFLISASFTILELLFMENAKFDIEPPFIYYTINRYLILTRKSSTKPTPNLVDDNKINYSDTQIDTGFNESIGLIRSTFFSTSSSATDDEVINQNEQESGTEVIKEETNKKSDSIDSRTKIPSVESKINYEQLSTDLSALKRLFDDGLISLEEYENLKRRLLEL